LTDAKIVVFVVYSN